MAILFVGSVNTARRGDSQWCFRLIHPSSQQRTVDRDSYRVWVLHFPRSQKVLSAIVMAGWLGYASQPPRSRRQQPQSNWTSPDTPCAKFDSLRKPLLGDIGVKIDATGPWANGFRRALGFWNTVLAANLHEETDLSTCSLRIIDGTPDILGHAVAARSQITDWANFKGKIAVSQVVAEDMNSDEIYAAAVHEIGHVLGLKHSANNHSVMFFLDVDGTDVLDGKDILDLSRRHKLRPAILAKGFVPIRASSAVIASKPEVWAIAPQRTENPRTPMRQDDGVAESAAPSANQK